MAYYDIALLHSDQDFLNRVAACYSQETTFDRELNPDVWVGQHSWDLAAAPGFGDAYAYALANENQAPGKDPSVITDGQILAAVQAILTAETPSES
jgi:hypothetical protein